MLDKPAGLPAHAGPRGGASAEDWFPILSRRRDGPWLAHRLDADTAGCLLVALRKAPLVEAQACFAAGRAGKRYWAVVDGVLPADGGRVSQPLSRRSEPGRGWRMVADPAGSGAETSWRVLGRGTDATGAPICWLELHLLTGRTHQARAHCAFLGRPVRGDPVYGAGGATGLQLLARSLFLPLDPPVRAEAPVLPHMRDALRRCGWTER